MRRDEIGGEIVYELAHDYLAAEIATWIDEATMQAKLARELLRQQVESWQRHGLLIAPEALRLIHEQREALARLSPGRVELLLRSALAPRLRSPVLVRARLRGRRGCRRHRAGGPAQRQLPHPRRGRDRAGAVGRALRRQPDPHAGRRLSPGARRRHRRLERLRPDGEWRKHLKYECYVPAGEFIMGDDKGDDDEKPAHKVYLAAFYIGKYPVTNTEYQRFMADRGRGFEMPAGKEHHPW